MIFLHRPILTLAFTLLCYAEVSLGQDRPVVFIHGLNSTDAAWADTATRLQAQLAVQVYRPNPGWPDVFQSQAAQVDAALGGLPASTVAVGHSNGGLVAREWSRHHALGGIVTLGTPNQGAPLAYNFLSWINYNFAAGDAISNVFGTVADCAAFGCGWENLIYYNGLHQLLSQIHGLLGSSLIGAASTIGVAIGAPVLAQMVPGSSFLSDLNSGSNIWREQVSVPGRVGVVSVAHNFYDAGAFRLVWPDDADTIDFWKDLSVYLLDFLSTYIYTNADIADGFAYRIAGAMSNASHWLGSLDQFWCETVSWPGGGICDYNDEVVPYWSQVLPGAPILLEQDGPIHTREIAGSDYYLYQALTYFMNIPPRGAGGGSGAGGNSGPMVQDSAIRGCSGYVEWPPVYQPNQNACASYCQSNGANACEWYQDGNCFVEFGSGCVTQGGFGGWWAGVFGSGNGGPAAGGGAGGGSPQMHGDSAIRGCANYVEHPQVYQPDANSCLSYCAQNGGHACEWYLDGSCFLETGSGCHVEGGFSGWSAAVIH